jgi:hypothetical protein
VIGLKKNADPHCFVVEMKVRSRSKSEPDLILGPDMVRDANPFDVIYIMRFCADEKSGGKRENRLTDIEILTNLLNARLNFLYGANCCSN